MTLFILSFAVNVVVTFTVASLILLDVPRTAVAFGADTPARRILACLYGSIGLLSLLALILIGVGQAALAVQIGISLFSLQIIYKLGSAATVGLRHPVVRANLAISILLALTLISYF